MRWRRCRRLWTRSVNENRSLLCAAAARSGRQEFLPTTGNVPTIHDVLSRRNDLSTFLVHLSRERISGSARRNFDQIIGERRLRASTPMGWAKAQDDPTDLARQSQRTVCFSETPLEHVHSLYSEIDGRSIRLEPYGLALTKVVARRVGVNPVWYVDMTTNGGREWEEARALDALRDRSVGTGDFHASPEAKIMPFFEHMGTWPTSRKEFWWEREWRHRGDLDLAPIWEKIIWLAPEGEHGSIASLICREEPGAYRPTLIDPNWGIEHIIARLCGLANEDVSLFHVSVRRELVDGGIRSAEAM